MATENRSSPRETENRSSPIETENRSSPREWYTFSFSLPNKPSRVRVSVWRKLKKAGAAGFGGGQWILPQEEESLTVFQELQQEIEQNNGEAMLARSTFENVETEERIIRQFNEDRAQEYDEFMHKCADLLRELEEETAEEKFTFAELDENDEMHARLADWFRKIRQRDFFNSTDGTLAEEKWSECEAALATFEQEVYKRSLETDSEPEDLGTGEVEL